MNICKNCEYYKKYRDKRVFGQCKCKKFLNANKLSWNYRRKKDTLEYWDYECYSCGFDVGEEFGCIHFTEKEKEK